MLVPYACSEEVAAMHGAGYHEADEPTWHGISTLSDDDVHMLAEYAKKYEKQGKGLQQQDDRIQRADAQRVERKAAEREKELLKKPVDPESTSTVVANLQHQLGLKMVEVNSCTAKLKQCTQKNPSDMRLGEASDDESPTTTAQEDWDSEHNDQEPYKHIWRAKPGQPIKPETETAVQEYERKQHETMQHSHHEPGFRQEHDRVFDESATELADQAKATEKIASESLDRAHTTENKTIATAEIKAVEAQKSEDVAEDQMAKKDLNDYIPSTTEKAIAEAEKKLAACKSDIVNKCASNKEAKKEPVD